MSGLQALDCQGRLDGINSNSHERVFMFMVRTKLGPHVVGSNRRALKWQEHAGDCHERAFTLWLREQRSAELTWFSFSARVLLLLETVKQSIEEPH